MHEAEQHVHRRGLPGAVRAEKAKDFSGANAQVQSFTATFLACPEFCARNSTRSFGLYNRFHGLKQASSA